MRIMVGGILQESNTFSSYRSGMNDFYQNLYLEKEQLLNISVRNEMKGFVEAAQEEGVELVPTLFASAVSAGKFARDEFIRLKQLLVSLVREALAGCGGSVDGILFALHGAMVAEECDDVEGELIAEIKREVGMDIPFVISLDAHANLTERIIRQVSGIVGYRTYPHGDFAETGYRAAKLLFSIASGKLQPGISMRKIPMVVPAENSQFHSGPCSELWKEAENGERLGSSTVTSIFPVQPWLDVEEFGSAVVVVGANQAAAEREADRLAELLWAKRHEFDIQLYNVRQIVETAIRQPAGGEPYVISDSADSPGAGSTGDSSAVLKELLDMGVQDRLTCLLTMVDAPAVKKAIEAGVGSTVELTVGHTVNRNPDHGGPIPVKGRVIKIGDGRFAFQGGFAAGMVANMGRCTVLQIGKIALLLSERPVFTGDPEMYRSMGLEPRKADIVLVKSANQFRADYERISRRIFILDTPGDSTANLKSLRFNKIQRPFYPFDDEFNWRAAVPKRV